MDSIDSFDQIVPLGKDAHRLAERFAAQQATLPKGKQVYLNTLAVYAVHSYLHWRQVETDLAQGDSWKPGIQALFNVADLVLPGIGKLECRPVMPHETAFTVPTEFMGDRIGYVAVQFNEQLDQVQLLGFSPAIAQGKSAEHQRVVDLKPLDGFIDHIHQISHQEAAAISTGIQAAQLERRWVNLRQWLQGIFEPEWQPLEWAIAHHFRNANRPAVTPDSTQPSISRAKVIDLGMQVAGRAVALTVRLMPTTAEEVDVRLRLYPTGDAAYLPPGLALTVLDAWDITCMETTARHTDNWIQLEFTAATDERFGVRLALGEVCIHEQFVV